MTTYSQDQLNQLASHHKLESETIFVGSDQNAFVCLCRDLDNPEFFQASLTWDCRLGEGPVTVRCGYYGQRLIRGDAMQGHTFDTLAEAVAFIPGRFDELAVAPSIAA